MSALRRPAILFAEDFDSPNGFTALDDSAETPESEVARITPEDLAGAREQAYAEGLERGLAQAAADRAEVTRQMLSAIGDRLMTAQAAAKQVAEDSAGAIARLLLGSLATMIPATCARYGENEVLAMARTILPTLAREPQIILKVSPHVAEAVAQELSRLDEGIAGKVSLVPTDTVAPGDVQIDWADGNMTRNSGDLWRRVVDTLAPLDLLPAESLHA